MCGDLRQTGRLGRFCASCSEENFTCSNLNASKICVCVSKYEHFCLRYLIWIEYWEQKPRYDGDGGGRNTFPSIALSLTLTYTQSEPLAIFSPSLSSFLSLLPTFLLSGTHLVLSASWCAAYQTWLSIIIVAIIIIERTVCVQLPTKN